MLFGHLHPLLLLTRIPASLPNIIIQHYANYANELLIQLPIGEPRPPSSTATRLYAGLDVHFSGRMLDGLHVADQVLAFQGFDSSAEDSIVEVCAGLDRFGPEAVFASFVD